MSGTRSGLGDLAIANPRFTNGLIAALGFAMLVGYAVIESIHDPITFMGVTLSADSLGLIGVVIKELGFAAMVAFLINFSIEAFNRRRHDKEKGDLIDAINRAHEGQRDAQIKAINQHIFQTVYERNIPSKLFREIEEQLLRSCFLRLESVFDIVLEPHSAGQVSLSMRHRFKIQNLSSGSAVYPLKLGFDVIKAFEGSYAVNEIRIGSTYLVGEAIPIEKSSKSAMHDWWEVVVDQPLEPNETVECVVDYMRISPEFGKEAICSRLPTEKMAVRVFDRQRAFSVRAMSLHTRPEIDRSSPRADGCYHWELDGALFPGQGFLIDWMPRAAHLNETGAPTI